MTRALPVLLLCDKAAVEGFGFAVAYKKLLKYKTACTF